MKKIIAAAVATAFVAPAFAADVTLSGDVEYTFTSKGNVVSGSTGDAAYKITATEELGNGLSIMAYVHLDDASDSDPRQSKMDISGAFGTIEIGNDAGEAIGEYDEVADVAEAGAGYTLTDNHSQDNSIVFHPATGIEGLNVALSYAAGSSTEDTSAWAYAIQYTVAGVTAAYGSIDKKGADFGASVTSLSGTFGPIYVGYEMIKNPEHDDDDTDMAENDSSTAIGITYNYGPGKLFFEQNTIKDDDAVTLDLEETAFGASYAIGSLNTYISFVQEKDGGTDADDATVVGVEYVF